MAEKAITDALESLRNCDGVEIIAHGATVLGVEVCEDSTTAGPAMDPVEVWADHQDRYMVRENNTTAGGRDSYTVTEV
jgi:hypothetical protein